MSKQNKNARKRRVARVMSDRRILDPNRKKNHPELVVKAAWKRREDARDV